MKFSFLFSRREKGFCRFAYLIQDSKLEIKDLYNFMNIS